jgi:hypothetical protein
VRCQAGEVSRGAIDCVGDGVWDCLTRGSRKQILDSNTDSAFGRDVLGFQ